MRDRAQLLGAQLWLYHLADHVEEVVHALLLRGNLTYYANLHGLPELDGLRLMAFAVCPLAACLAGLRRSDRQCHNSR